MFLRNNIETWKNILLTFFYPIFIKILIFYPCDYGRKSEKNINHNRYIHSCPFLMLTSRSHNKSGCSFSLNFIDRPLFLKIHCVISCKTWFLCLLPNDSGYFPFTSRNHQTNDWWFLELFILIDNLFRWCQHFLFQHSNYIQELSRKTTFAQNSYSPDVIFPQGI